MFPLYQSHSAAAQAAFANLQSAALHQALERRVADLPGGFTRKRVGLREYWYYQVKLPSGKAIQIYLGSQGEALDRLIHECSVERRTATEHLVRLSRAAIELGASVLERTHWRILERLSDHGFFHAGGVLIGTHAFLAYQNHLGVNWTQATQTMDLDFSHPGNNMSIALPDGIRMDARSAIESLQMGFVPTVSQTTFVKADEPDLQLDFVTARHSDSDEPIRIAPLNMYMQPLRYMSYSTEATHPAVLVSRQGPLVVHVPLPARFALHKLIVTGERPAELQIKARKDVTQAACLISCLQDNSPEELIDAWRAICQYGPNWIKRCQAGAVRMKRHYPQIDTSFMGI